jgi:hypothetical protein
VWFVAIAMLIWLEHRSGQRIRHNEVREGRQRR